MKWFKHPSNSAQDPKFEKLVMRYGAEGYALYWLCIELIAAPIDKENITFELEHDAEILAYRLKMDQLRVEEIMRYMISLELFEISETTSKITCLKLALIIENSLVKSPELMRIKAQLRGDETIQTDKNDPGSSGIIPDDPGKVRPEENRREEKIDMSELPVRDVPIQSKTDRSKITKVQQEKIIALYHEILPELPKVMVDRWHGSAHAKQLATRWKEDEQFRTAQFWRSFFESVRLNPWWMGVPDKASGQSWTGCKLAWLVKRSNFDKVLERGGWGDES